MNELVQTYEAYVLPFMTVMIVIMLVLLFLVLRYKNIVKAQKLTLEEKEEKIIWFRQKGAECDRRYLSKEHEDQKKIIELEHTISMFEARAKEGTKNQVVSKIDEEQSKRARLLERLSIKV